MNETIEADFKSISNIGKINLISFHLKLILQMKLNR